MTSRLTVNSPIPKHLRRVSVVVPTYREAANLPHLIDRLARVREENSLDLDLLIMDDDSRDGSVDVIHGRKEAWVKIVVRTTDRGLSPAVLDGFHRAEGAVLVCMDADLSHPPEALPAMLHKLGEGADFVIGSRYVDGGSTADDWGFLRWLNSRVATLLAMPLTSAKDPMAGFFALERTTFARGTQFNPVGYKIGLELLVKCRCERVVETPIHFEDRQFGESKLTLWQQILYIQHLRRLYVFKYGAWSQLVQFLLVGALGTLVNIGVLTATLALGWGNRTSVVAAIVVSMLFNFALNRRYSFDARRSGNLLRQLGAFVTASSVGAGISYVVTMWLNFRFAELPLQGAALGGVVSATAFNFMASRYLVFRATRVRPTSAAEASAPSEGALSPLPAAMGDPEDHQRRASSI